MQWFDVMTLRLKLGWRSTNDFGRATAMLHAFNFMVVPNRLLFGNNCFSKKFNTNTNTDMNMKTNTNMNMKMKASMHMHMIMICRGSGWHHVMWTWYDLNMNMNTNINCIWYDTIWYDMIPIWIWYEDEYDYEYEYEYDYEYDMIWCNIMKCEHDAVWYDE